MAAGITDKFLKVGVAGTLTTLAAPGHGVGGTTITIDSVTNWPTDTAVIFGMRQVDTSGNLVPNTYTEWRGVVSGSTITGMVLMYGSDQIYPTGSSTQVFIPLSAAHWNRLIDAILQEHDQDGTHGNITTGTITAAGAITAPSITISGTATTQGWTPVGATPATVTPLGNRSYNLVFNATDLTSILSKGMRLQMARTVAAPVQSTLLNGTNQYFSKSSPSGMTFTDDFTVSAWIKLTSYSATDMSIASRYNGTSGWDLQVNVSGQLVLIGYNASGSNFSRVVSKHSIPLNKWVHVAAQLDMSTFTASATTSYTMIDGLDAPAAVSRGGTNPTALVQAGNFEIGGRNGGTQPFPGAIAQVAVYSAKVTQATILAALNRTMSGSETSLVSAYTLSNSVTDLNANANNLTAQNAATTTNADAPFADAQTAGTLEYGIVMKTAFSTNTTVTVQVPMGCELPSTGGISSVNYSTHKNPYAFPGQMHKWEVVSDWISGGTQASPSSNTWYNVGGYGITLPVGAWKFGYKSMNYLDLAGAGDRTVSTTLSTSSSTPAGDFANPHNPRLRIGNLNSNIFFETHMIQEEELEVATATPYYHLMASVNGASATTLISQSGRIKAINAYL